MRTLRPISYPVSNASTLELLMRRRSTAVSAQGTGAGIAADRIGQPDAAEVHHAGYVKLGDDAAVVPLATRTDPTLACWVALVQAWDGIEGTLQENDAAAGAKDAAPMTSVRPFG
ncbi:hypothetical protein GCM10007386_11720 [Pseudoduganella dura]|nr:hypothetical protein GCM10007386_11720 [Pseudoduganella dura]